LSLWCHTHLRIEALSIMAESSMKNNPKKKANYTIDVNQIISSSQQNSSVAHSSTNENNQFNGIHNEKVGMLTSIIYLIKYLHLFFELFVRMALSHVHQHLFLFRLVTTELRLKANFPLSCQSTLLI
jgi:hypothetical protein